MLLITVAWKNNQVISHMVTGTNYVHKPKKKTLLNHIWNAASFDDQHLALSDRLYNNSLCSPLEIKILQVIDKQGNI